MFPDGEETIFLYALLKDTVHNIPGNPENTPYREPAVLHFRNNRLRFASGGIKSHHCLYEAQSGLLSEVQFKCHLEGRQGRNVFL